MPNFYHDKPGRDAKRCYLTRRCSGADQGATVGGKGWGRRLGGWEWAGPERTRERKADLETFVSQSLIHKFCYPGEGQPGFMDVHERFLGLLRAHRSKHRNHADLGSNPHWNDIDHGSDKFRLTPHDVDIILERES